MKRNLRQHKGNEFEERKMAMKIVAALLCSTYGHCGNISSEVDRAITDVVITIR